MRRNVLRLLGAAFLVAAAAPLAGCADGYSSVSYAYGDGGYYDDYGYYHRHHYRPYYGRPYSSFSFGYRD